MHEPVPVNPSIAEGLADCAWRFRQEQSGEIKDPAKIAGTVMHAALAAYINHCVASDKDSDPTKMLRLIEQHLPACPESHRAELRNDLTLFADDYRVPRDGGTHSVEQPITVNLQRRIVPPGSTALAVSMRLDYVHHQDKGKRKPKIAVVLTDWKRGGTHQLADGRDAKMPQSRSSQLPHDLAMRWMIWGLQFVFPDHDHMRAVHWYLRTGHWCRTSKIKPLSQASSDAVWQEILSCHKQWNAMVASGEFPCNPQSSSCPKCQFGPHTGNDSCPAFRAERENVQRMMRETRDDARPVEPDPDPPPPKRLARNSTPVLFLHDIGTELRRRTLDLITTNTRPYAEVVDLDQDSACDMPDWMQSICVKHGLMLSVPVETIPAVANSMLLDHPIPDDESALTDDEDSEGPVSSENEIPVQSNTPDQSPDTAPGPACPTCGATMVCLDCIAEAPDTEEPMITPKAAVNVSWDHGSAVTRPPFRILIFGPPGCYKTRSILQAFADHAVADAKYRLSMIDLDHGSEWYQQNPDQQLDPEKWLFFALRLLEEKGKALGMRKSLELIEGSISQLPEGVRTIVIDSLSLYCDLVYDFWTEIYRRREVNSPGNRGEYYILQMRDHTNPKRHIGRFLVQRLLRTNCDVVCTARIKPAYERRQKGDPRDKMAEVTGDTADTWMHSAYYFDTVIGLELEKDPLGKPTGTIFAHCEKDRSNTLPVGKFEWHEQCIANALKGLQPKVLGPARQLIAEYEEETGMTVDIPAKGVEDKEPTLSDRDVSDALVDDDPPVDSGASAVVPPAAAHPQSTYSDSDLIRLKQRVGHIKTQAKWVGDDEHVYHEILRDIRDWGDQSPTAKVLTGNELVELINRMTVKFDEDVPL